MPDDKQKPQGGREPRPPRPRRPLARMADLVDPGQLEALRRRLPARPQPRQYQHRECIARLPPPTRQEIAWGQARRWVASWR